MVPNATSEIELLKDIDGDGKPEVLYAGPQQVMSYANPDPANPTAPWTSPRGSGRAGPHGRAWHGSR